MKSPRKELLISLWPSASEGRRELYIVMSTQRWIVQKPCCTSEIQLHLNERISFLSTRTLISLRSTKRWWNVESNLNVNSEMSIYTSCCCTFSQRESKAPLNQFEQKHFLQVPARLERDSGSWLDCCCSTGVVNVMSSLKLTVGGT